MPPAAMAIIPMVASMFGGLMGGQGQKAEAPAPPPVAAPPPVQREAPRMAASQAQAEDKSANRAAAEAQQRRRARVEAQQARAAGGPQSGVLGTVTTLGQ